MKIVSGFCRWRLWAGALATGVFAFSLSLEGAPTGRSKLEGRILQADKGIQATNGESQNAAGESKRMLDASFPVDSGTDGSPVRVFHGRLLGLTHAPHGQTITVNYLDDEPSRMRAAGELVGPYRPRKFQGGVAGVLVNACGGDPTADGSACTFNIDCDDCDPCTRDVCDIDITVGEAECDGTCVHTAVLDSVRIDGCDNGEFCDLQETCQSGICEPPGFGSGNVDDPDFLLPCGGRCFGGPSNNERCGKICTGDVGVCSDASACSISGQDCGDASTCQPIACDDNGDCGAETCVGDDAECPGGTCEVAVCDEDAAQGRNPFGNSCAPNCNDRRCDDNSDNPGALCDGTPGQCPNGTCLTPDENCDNGLFCDGTESCDPSGVCVFGDPDLVCGGADCAEKSCNNSLPCSTDDDCTTGSCQARGEAACFFGRCCTPTGGGEFECRLAKFDRDFGPGGLVKKCDPNLGELFSGDTCNSELTGSNCSAGGSWNTNQGICPPCPKVGSGISPTDDVDNVTFVGQVSDAVCAGLPELGDDYQLSNHPGFMAVELLSFWGHVETIAEERMSIEFYDEFGNFIEDTFFVSGSAEIIRNLRFEPAIPIPSKGWIVWRVASDFAPNGRIFLGVVDSTDVGVNDAAKVWINGGPYEIGVDGPAPFGRCTGGDFDGLGCDPRNGDADCTSTFPGSTPGACVAIPAIIGFEISGEKIGTPTVACCGDDGNGNPICDERLPWECPKSQAQEGSCTTCTAGNIGAKCGGCSGGPNDGLECTNSDDCAGSPCVPDDLHCRLCDDGLTPCPTGTECGAGTCSIAGTCELLVNCATGACCRNGTCTDNEDLASCPVTGAGAGDFQGFGTTCDPDCCVQSGDTFMSGADNCGDAFVHLIAVPPPSVCVGGPTPGAPCSVDSQCTPGTCENSPPVVLTITGDNSGATIEDPLNGGCDAGAFDPDSNDPENTDLGWWERFSINDCAFVRLDMCCSDPVHQPQWNFVYQGGANNAGGCPCGAAGAFATGNVQSPFKPDPDNPDQFLPANNRGEPFCDDDNLWWQFGPLEAGTYTIPIFSTLAGTLGQYQLHATVEACPVAACCHRTCSAGSDNAGDACNVDSECTGGTCDQTCLELNSLECDKVGGVYLGPPNKFPAITFCLGNTCTSGSCCEGPGQCKDNVLGDPMTKTDCPDPFTFFGGIKCRGGTCAGDTDFSCVTIGDCIDQGTTGPCTVDQQIQFSQPSPCPICEFEDKAHCQFSDPDLLENGNISDHCIADCVAEPDNGHVYLADDFVAAQDGTITKICVLGAWWDQGPGGLPDCFNSGPNEEFTVAIYNDDGAPGGKPGMPGTDADNGNGARAFATTIASGVDGTLFGDPVIRYVLELAQPVAVQVGNTYWLEVVANSDPAIGAPECDFFWGLVEKPTNDYNYWDFGDAYNVEDVNNADVAFCLDVPMAAPGPVSRACCSCQGAGGAAGADPNCTVTSFDLCAGQLEGQWFVELAECAGDFTCPNSLGPPNDTCVNAQTVGVGRTSLTNFCADGSPFPLDTAICDGAADPNPMVRDIFYEFTPAVTQQYDISLCDPELDISWDSAMEIFGEIGTPDGICDCPSDNSSILGECSDDGCVFTGGGPRIIETLNAGECYVIRVASVDNTQGNGTLIIDDNAAQPKPDTPSPADDTCYLADGTDTGNTCTQESDCNAGEVCNSKNRHLSAVFTDSAGGAEAFAVNIELVSAPDWPGASGNWWAAAPVTESEGPTGGSYARSQLECTATPAVLNWDTLGSPENGGAIDFWGREVVPNAVYAIRTAFQACVDAGGFDCMSDPLFVETSSLWADIVGPFKNFAAPQPDFGDIGAEVDKFKSKPGAPRKARALLCGEVLDPVLNVGFDQIGAAVSGFKGKSYKITCDPQPVGPQACP